MQIAGLEVLCRRGLLQRRSVRGSVKRVTRTGRRLNVLLSGLTDAQDAEAFAEMRREIRHRPRVRRARAGLARTLVSWNQPVW